MAESARQPIEGRLFLVEWYWPGVTEEKLLAALARADRAAEEMTREGTSVRYLHSLLMPSDEAVFCVFAGPSGEAVAEAARRAGIAFERVAETVLVTAGSPASSPDPWEVTP